MPALRNAPAAALLLAALIATRAGTAADTGIDASADRILAKEGLTGVAWALIAGDEITLGAAGVKDNDSGLAFGPGTRFHVGSLTKTVLATGILRLATERRLDLDAPALGYLPELFPDQPPAGFADITVRHLMDHTAGLNDAELWQLFSEKADPDAPLAAAFPDPVSQLRLRSVPGARFSYSNIGYTLLGMIIESVTGRRYEHYLDEHLLAPLNMHDSTFAFTAQHGSHRDPSLAWGHIDDGSRYLARPSFLRPAAQFTTTTGDLALFGQFLLGDGRIDGDRFIDEALMRARGVPISTEAAVAGLDTGYALGLGRRDRHGVVGYCHGGNTVGFVAMLCIFPDEQKAFAYSVNTDSETANYSRLAATFVAELGIADVPGLPTASPAPDVSAWHGRYVLSPNRFAMFEYLDTVFGAVRLSADGDGLLMKSLEREPRELRPTGNRVFAANDRTTTSHVLLQSVSGEYLISDGFQTFRKVSSVYLVGHWLSVLLGVAGLAWAFLAGAVALLRQRSAAWQQSVAPAFFAALLLFLPAPFFYAQSFMALGDLTLASALLATVTLLLPIGMAITLLRARRRWRSSLADAAHAVAAILVLQWCVVLASAGLLPFLLWA